MALRNSDAKGNNKDPSTESVTIISKDVISGLPCIDFQPDDRWQIKDDDINSKKKDMQCSNGRRSQRLRDSTKSCDSTMTNGEKAESSSDDESQKNDSSAVPVENASKKGARPKRKRTSSVTESENLPDKKLKENDEDSSTSNTEKTDSNKIITKNKDSPRANGSDANSAADIIEDCNISNDLEHSSKSDDLNLASTETNNCPSTDIEQSENKVLLKDDEVNTLIENDVEKGAKSDASKSSKDDDDIEIINIDDDKKSQSDEESDSEIQMISINEIKKEEKEVEIVPEDFPAPCSSDVRLTPGYPYYNSLKEKIPKFKAGEYKPVKFPHTGTLLLAENEVIIESPSLLVPLLIKEADAFPQLGGEQKKAVENILKPMMSRKNFFQSSVGQFLINLGKSRVDEWYHRDMKHTKLKQFKKNKTPELETAVEEHENKHNALKEINAIFSPRMRQCKYCEFKSESQIVMEGHYLSPHLSPRREYMCNFCTYMARDPEAIVFHFDALHGKKAILQSNMFFHECIFCSFQSHLKTKVNAHMNRCRKHFIPSQNLAPPFDFEFPGVTTKPVTIADVIGHRRMLLNSKNRMPGVPEDNSANSALARKKLASVLTKLTGQNAYVEMKNPNLMKQLMNPQGQQLSGSRIQLPPGIVITRPSGPGGPPLRTMGRYPPPRNIAALRGPQPLRRGPPFASNLTSAASHLASAGISITPVRNGMPLRTNTSATGKNVTLTPINTANRPIVGQRSGAPQPVALYTNMPNNSLIGQPQTNRMPMNVTVRPLRPAAPYQRLNTPPSQVVKGSSGNTFVVCEICDSYIKDLEELRTHMNWVHKVKIHPKMLVSRPPLNCQKCQWRFFTDQGLERHLLGAHGLVTTNMQEMANKNQDGGRCIICGAVFTYKLVSHMTQVHKVTLKPAHLSYKCTVCTATFTLYRLFESHVYNVHSGSAKRSAEDSQSEPPAKKVAEDLGPKKCKGCGVVTENMDNHIIQNHIKDCAVKLCRIEKCEKCLYPTDEMLVIRMSDFGLESEDSDDSGDDSSEDSSDKETG